MERSPLNGSITCLLFYTGGGDDDVESSSSIFEVESDGLSEDESLYDETKIFGRFYNYSVVEQMCSFWN